MRINGLSLTLNHTHLLKNVGFQIPESSIFLLLGPNGAGKTLLLKCLTGLLKPDGSEFPILQKPKHHAWVPLSQSLPFAFAVYEILLMGRFEHHGGHPGPKDKEVARSVSDRLGITHLWNRSYNSLSRGEQTKVDIARAVASEAAWIFLDEPFSNLDIDASLHIIDFFQALRSEGRTLVMSHHDLYSAKALGTHGLLIKQGEVLKSGEIHSVLDEKAIEEAYNVRPQISADGQIIGFKRT